MIGAELNASIQEEWPAPDTHARRLREWLEEKADEVRNGNGEDGDDQADAKPENAETPLAPPTS
jgi:membrane protein